jgi:predicted metalloprotease
MRWRPSGQTQVEDRRGAGGLGGLGGMRMGGLGGGGGIPIPIGGGLGGIVVVIIIIVVMNLMGGGGGVSSGLQGAQGGAIASLAPGDDQGQFINAITVDVQSFWTEEFSAAGRSYPVTSLVLFTDSTQSGCGVASSQTGPFYCPGDQKVYLDAGFFDELHSRFAAPGDFAEAYVIAHEFGHHVQDALGTMDQVGQEQQAGSDPGGANGLSVRLELQADCYAGVWANSVWTSPDQANVESITEADVNEAIGAAQAVGDDRIQEQATGTINKETWTHGSASQRAKWFNAGFKSGTMDSCDTFNAATL